MHLELKMMFSFHVCSSAGNISKDNFVDHFKVRRLSVPLVYEPLSFVFYYLIRAFPLSVRYCHNGVVRFAGLEQAVIFARPGAG